MAVSSTLAFKSNVYKTYSRCKIHHTIAYALSAKRYADSAKPIVRKMPYIIQPTILLDADKVPLEKDIYEAYNANQLDTKNLLVIGYMAVASSTKHLRTDAERRDLTTLKETYDRIINDLKNDYGERAELMANRIIADKDKDIQVLKERLANMQQSNEATIAKISAEKERELAQYREQMLASSTNAKSELLRALEIQQNENAVLREQLNTVSSNIELVVAKSILEKEKELSARNSSTSNELAVLSERIDTYKQRTFQLEKELEEARDSSKATTSELLKNLRDEEISALQAQIAALKGSNFSKGILGEGLVRQWLSDAFDDCEIIDKSGCAAESDIHVVKPNGDFIAVECKNKTQITNQDVDKSMRDITFLKEKYGARFVGYVFVSLRSINIPKKGSGCLEIVDDRIPVYWYGQTEFNEEDRTMINFCKAIWSVVAFIKTLRAKLAGTNNEVESFRKQLHDMLTMVSATLERLNQNQKTIAVLLQNAKAIQDNNNAALQLVTDYVTTSNLHANLSTSTTKLEHVCPHCSRGFSQKGHLTRHLSKCAKQQ